jgi:coenzyme Q-binding protein COQ10
MPAHSEIRSSPYSPAQLYAMVIDIEHYPEFLPWCRAARIVERHSDYFLGELIVSFSHLTERYTSKVVGSPATDATEGRIEVNLVSGPFEYLGNHWRFVPTPTGTEIHFAVDFKFKSALLEKLIGGMFGRAIEKMGDAFMKRADALYGTQDA